MIRSKVAALVRFAKTRAIPQGLQKSRGAEKVTGSAHISNIVRTLFFARGRSRRFDVSPTIRQARKLFSTYPIFSNSIFYGGLFVAAEFMQQTWNKGILLSPSCEPKCVKHLDSPHPRTYDVGSVKRYAVWGALVIPPIYYRWYQWLDARFRMCKTGPINPRTLTKKLVLDQFLLTPVILAMFFVAMNAMEGKSDWFEECKHKFWKTFAADCCFWLPVQALNFIFVPSDLRVAFIAVTTFLWLNVLCWLKSLPITSSNSKEQDSLSNPLILANAVSTSVATEID